MRFFSLKNNQQFKDIPVIILSMFLALIMAYAGRYIFSLPFILAILPLIKTKAGISLFQILRLWGLFRVLRNSGRFSQSQFGQTPGSTKVSVDDAYKLLGLKKGCSKNDVIKAAAKLQKKIHPDVNRDVNTEELSKLVNEAKEKVLKELV